jgi:excinuclease ABC subunit C
VQILLTKPKLFVKRVKNAPLTPGVYKYLDKNKKIIYIGKAKVLRNRVKSYFSGFKNLEAQKQQMILESKYIDFVETDSEIEALILEANLIKKHKTRYNILMRDDKSYVYVRFEKIRKLNQKVPTKHSVYQDFPRITTIRNKKNDGADYFGPFPESQLIKSFITKIRKVYPFRTSSSKDLVYEKDGEIISSSKKISLEVHLGLTGGAELGYETKKEYLKRFKKIKAFFEGKTKVILKNLESEMLKASKEMDFEKAARLRDQIFSIKYATQTIHIDREMDDVALESIKLNQRKNAIASLIEYLDFPAEKLKVHKNFKIECYDISNFQGKLAVGSMVVMVNGKNEPSLYRRFKIKMENEPNDFAMHQEVLTRRFKNFFLQNLKKNQVNSVNNEYDLEIVKKAKNWKDDKSFRVKPDLIIIDGGKGQLAYTYKVLYNFGLHNDIPIIGLAKREEEIFKFKDQFNDEYVKLDNSSQFKRILLPRKSECLYLVQRIRDEAHRFAITYHKNLRSKKLLEF